MALPVIFGILDGIVGFIPLIGATVAVKRVTSTSNFSHASILLLAVLGSTLVLAGGVVACVLLSRENVLAFAGGEVAGLLGAALVFIISRRLME